MLSTCNKQQLLRLIWTMIRHTNTQNEASNDIQDYTRIRLNYNQNWKYSTREHNFFLLSSLSSFWALSLSLLCHFYCHYLFLSTNQIKLTILQEHPRSSGTIISSPGPMGILISSILGSILSSSPKSFTFPPTTIG